MTSKDSRLSDEVLLRALSNEHEVEVENVQLLEWTSKAGNAAGENFATDMVAVEGKAKIKGDKLVDFSYMTKVTPVQKIRADMVEKMGIFERECLMYREILPKMAKVRKEKGLRPIQVPKCFYASGNPGILIMENLKLQGFSLIKSMDEGMDEGEVKHFLEALAEIHASGYHLMATYQNGGKNGFLADFSFLKRIKTIGEGLEQGFKTAITTIMSDLAEAIAEEEEFGPEVSRKIKNFVPLAFYKWKDAFFTTVGNFTTIIHGDAWANNAMFRHDENGETKDLAMIDFQISRNTNPAFDLAYGLTTCTNGEKRIENLEKWQRIWYDRFSHDMEVLGFDAQRLYPFDDFLVDYSNFYGMGFAFSMQAYQLLLKKDEHFDVSQFSQNDSDADVQKTMENARKSAVRQMKTNPVYRQRNLSLVKEALAMGFFDSY